MIREIQNWRAILTQISKKLGLPIGVKEFSKHFGVKRSTQAKGQVIKFLDYIMLLIPSYEKVIK